MKWVCGKVFFEELSIEESLLLEGGVDWNLVSGTLATSGGAYIGAKIGASVGTSGGPVRSVVSGLIGGVVGAVIYSFWDEEDISMNYIESREKETMKLNGGLLAGALAGAILGGIVGIIAATVKGVATGNLSENEVWKCYTSLAIAGAAIGAHTPV